MNNPEAQVAAPPVIVQAENAQVFSLLDAVFDHVLYQTAVNIWLYS